jgi:hypothetical protein
MTRSRQFELVRAEPKEERGMAAIGATLSSERLLAKDSNSPKPPINVVTRQSISHNSFSITASQKPLVTACKT